MILDQRTDPRVARYIKGVLSGQVVVGRLVRLAVERHVRDLETGRDRGLWFDFEAAQAVLDFCNLVHHSKGQWAGRVFEPEDWQAFFFWCLFGWQTAAGWRRYREALLEVAKKNGKSFMAAVVALIGLVFDCEPGAEVYSAATLRKQARLIWDEAAAIVRASPALKSRIEVLGSTLEHGAAAMVVPGTRSKFEPMSADADSLDGPSVHIALCDELHRHRNRKVYDVLKQGTAGRTQPLILSTTTAGDEDETSIYAELHEYSVQVLEGVVQDDALFAFVAALDDGDDWHDETTWVKANPNLGVSVLLDGMRGLYAQAVAKPGEEATFKRFRLNIRTTSTTPWLALKDWKACRAEIDWSRFDGVPCFGGLDLAQKTDLCAHVQLWERDGLLWVRTWAWCPEAGITRRSELDRAPYRQWQQEGYLTATPGDLTDYQFIEARLLEQHARTPYQALGFDQAHAADLSVRLSEGGGLPMVQVPAGTTRMTMPVSRIEDYVLAGKLRHDGNPVLQWCVHNAKVQAGANDTKKLIKTSPRARIDAAIAMLIAVERALTAPPPPKGSVYKRRGVQTFETLRG